MTRAKLRDPVENLCLACQKAIRDEISYIVVYLLEVNRDWSIARCENRANVEWALGRRVIDGKLVHLPGL